MAAPITAAPKLLTVNQWLDTQRPIYNKQAEDKAGAGEVWKSIGVGLGVGAAVGTVAGLVAGKGFHVNSGGASGIGIGLGVVATVLGSIYLAKADVFKGNPDYPTDAEIADSAFNHFADNDANGNEIQAGGSNLWTDETFAESSDSTQTSQLRAKFGQIDRDHVYSTAQAAIDAGRAEGGDHVIMPAEKALSHIGGDKSVGEPSLPPTAGYYVYDVVGDVGAQLNNTTLKTQFKLPETHTWLQHGNDVLIQHDGQIVKLQEPVPGN